MKRNPKKVNILDKNCCVLCGGSFISRMSLNEHFKIVHKINDFFGGYSTFTGIAQPTTSINSIPGSVNNISELPTNIKTTTEPQQSGSTSNFDEQDVVSIVSTSVPITGTNSSVSSSTKLGVEQQIFNTDKSLTPAIAVGQQTLARTANSELKYSESIEFVVRATNNFSQPLVRATNNFSQPDSTNTPETFKVALNNNQYAIVDTKINKQSLTNRINPLDLVTVVKRPATNNLLPTSQSSRRCSQQIATMENAANTSQVPTPDTTYWGQQAFSPSPQTNAEQPSFSWDPDTDIMPCVSPVCILSEPESPPPHQLKHSIRSITENVPNTSMTNKLIPATTDHFSPAPMNFIRGYFLFNKISYFQPQYLTYFRSEPIPRSQPLSPI